MIDVEAVILPMVNVVEQLGVVLMSAASGEELLAERHMVYQPLDACDLSAEYELPYDLVNRSVLAYRHITGDNPVHADPTTNVPWNAVRNRIRKILRRRAIKIYAKGAGLERSVFSGTLVVHELEDVGCPKYPGEFHDPLEECRFFSRYIPELKRI